MSASSKIALICGDGYLPQEIALACQKRGLDVMVIALQGQVSKSWYEAYPHETLRMGAVGKILNTLKKHGISQILLAGTIRRPSLAELRPDFAGMKYLAKIGSKATGDDGILSYIVQLLGEEGFEVVGAHELLPEILATPGSMTPLSPSKQDVLDAQKGFHVAKSLGQLDVGQAVIVEEGLVLAVEGIEGTAALIHRTKELKRLKKAGVLVKVAKPQQTLKVDMPSIGPQTIEQVAACGLNGIVLEAGKCLIIEKEKTLLEANKNQVFIYGLSDT